MKRLLWDVDTQVDFIDADGKLAVPDAEARVPAMARLVEWARREGIPHVASADDHELTDPEISESPDYADTYPPHCLRGTSGADKIAETEQADPVPLGATDVPEEWLRGREFLIHKKHFDVFTNPNTERLLEHFKPDEIVLFGVATDICNDAAIKGCARGLRRHIRRGRIVRHRRRAVAGLHRRLAGWRRADRDRRRRRLVTGSIHHVGIAVDDLEAAIARWTALFGATLEHRERVEDQGVEAASLRVGASADRALAPLGEDTPVGKFLAKRGPGVHHVAFETADVGAELARLKADGVELIDETPRRGMFGLQVGFVHPEATGGVLAEFVGNE